MINISRMTIMTMTFMFCLTCLVLSGTAFADRGVDNGDGTLTHTGSNLMWQKLTDGLKNWDDAMSYATSLSLGGHFDWRLPTVNEWQIMYNSPCRHMINTRGGLVWTYSENSQGFPFSFKIYHGTMSIDVRDSRNSVVAVRWAQ